MEDDDFMVDEEANNEEYEEAPSEASAGSKTEPSSDGAQQRDPQLSSAESVDEEP